MKSTTHKIIAVCKNAEHTFSKQPQVMIELIEGLGVKGDAHAGATVKHRSRVRADASQPNLRQVHLIHSELHQELEAKGFDVKPGDMGENITTAGIDLLALPVDTVLHCGNDAKIKITGLRNPCSQLDKFQPGLMKAVIEKDTNGNIIRKSGIMGIVLKSGIISADDLITIEWPEKPHKKLEKV